MALTAGFELGTLDAEVQTTDAGNATAWDSIDRNASIKYDATHALGTKAAYFHTTAGEGTVRLRWEASFGTQTEYYGRACLYRTANPADERTHVLHGRSGGTGVSWSIRINSTGKIVVTDQAFNTLATSTASIPLDQFFRLEWHINNTTGFIEVLLYNDATSAILTETVISGTPGGLGADTTFSEFGFSALSQDVWYDALVDGDVAYPGPVGEADEHHRFAGPQLLAGTAATVYTAPASGARIDTIHVSNPSGSPVDFTLSIGTDAAGTRLWDGYSIPADSVWERQLYLPLANGEIVQSFASTAGVLVLTLDGKTL